jgi:hypothetical protein
VEIFAGEIAAVILERGVVTVVDRVGAVTQGRGVFDACMCCDQCSGEEEVEDLHVGWFVCVM